MLIFLMIAAVLPAMTFGYPVASCGYEYGPPPHVIRIADCDTSPCHLNQGDDIAFEIDFTVLDNSATLNLNVTVTVFGLSFNFPVPDNLANVCNWINGQCPVSAGQELTYATAIPLAIDFSGGIPAEFRADILMANGESTLCTLVRVIIH